MDNYPFDEQPFYSIGYLRETFMLNHLDGLKLERIEDVELRNLIEQHRIIDKRIGALITKMYLEDTKKDKLL